MASASETGRWASTVPGLVGRLQRGARVAVIACGRGETAVALAQVFPACVVSGFDHRAREIAVARLAAATVGVSDRVTFEVADLGSLRGSNYDVVCVVSRPSGS